MIPVIGIPVLNRYELLDRLLASIDHEVGRVIIVDNGGSYAPDPLLRFPVHVITMPHNIGVGASWNLIFKVSPAAPWWCILNSDLVMGAGDLARLDAAVDPGSASVYEMSAMAAFALTAPALDRVGYFDENFHPAYDEDLDWSRRADLLAVPVVQVGFTGTHVGSATIHSDWLLRAKNSRTHPLNDVYYAKKWGGPKQGGETHSTPFGRGGDMGDWRLEPARLRDQAW